MEKNFNTTENEIKENKMGTEPMMRLLYSMSLPAIVSMLLLAVYNVVDSIFVSRISEEALAAVTLVFPVQMLLVAVSVGAGVGLNSLISRRLGEKRFEEADSAAANGFFIQLIHWLLFLIVGITLLKPFFEWYSDDPSLIGMANDYGQIVICVSVFMFMQVTCEKILQSTGNMILPMISSMVGCIVNIILDPVFIFGWLGVPAMGVSGAAIATVIGQFFGMCCTGVFFFLGNHPVKARFKGFRPNAEIIKDIYAVGLPGMIMQSIPSVVTIFLNAILITFSTTAVSVLGVYFRLQSFAFMPMFGLTQGAMPIMGYNFGARNKQRLNSVTKLTIITGIVIMAIGFVIFQLMPETLMSMFDATGDMMDMGIMAMRLLSLCFIPAAVGITFSTYFQALGYGIYSLLMTLIRQMFVILPAAWLLSGIIGVTGVWLSYPIAEIFGFVTGTVLFVKLYNKRVKNL